MSWTDEPPGSRPNCSSCGGFNWAWAGYCLSMKCAGHYKDEDYPRSKPQHLKDADAARGNRNKAGNTTKKAKPKKVKMPPKGTRRSTELWYEAQGKKAPWLEKRDDEHEHS